MKAALILTALATAVLAEVPYLKHEGDVIADQYIVVFEPSADPRSTDKFVANFNSTFGSFNIGQFRGFSGRFSADEVAEIRRQDGLVEYIEEDGLVHALAVQENPPSWGLDRIDQQSLPLNSRYNYYDTAGRGVDIYVMDTGIRVTHQDFGGRARFGWKAQDSWSEQDNNGHGTHCSGSAAGTLTGLAKNAGLVAVKVLGDNGSGAYSGVINGVNWSFDQSVKNRDVGTMSLGGGGCASLDNAINSAVRGGFWITVAAGNSNNDACNNYSPARAEEAFTVMSSDRNDIRSSFSSYGACCQIFAPGSSIYAAYVPTDTSYATLSGTSMATPHVAGAAAVMQAQRARSPAELTRDLIAAGTPNVISNVPSSSPNLMLFSPYQ